MNRPLTDGGRMASGAGGPIAQRTVWPHRPVPDATMCVGSPTAGAWSSFQRRPDDEFETDRRPVREAWTLERRHLRGPCPFTSPRPAASRRGWSTSSGTSGRTG